MVMTISEASAVNTLLDCLLGPLHKGDEDRPHTDKRIVEAASYLAERSNRALQAGWNGGTVVARRKKLVENVRMIEALP